MNLRRNSSAHAHAVNAYSGRYTGRKIPRYMRLRSNRQSNINIAVHIRRCNRVVADVQANAFSASDRKPRIRKHEVHIRSSIQQLTADPRPLLLARINVPWATRSKVHINRSIVGAVAQINCGNSAEKTQMPPQPRIEVTSGILQIALKIPIPAVGHL